MFASSQSSEFIYRQIKENKKKITRTGGEREQTQRRARQTEAHNLRGNKVKMTTPDLFTPGGGGGGAGAPVLS